MEPIKSKFSSPRVFQWCFRNCRNPSGLLASWFFVSLFLMFNPAVVTHALWLRGVSLGLALKLSVEALAVELEVSSQPLQQSYAKYEKRVTWCWLLSLWKKCSKFKINVCFRNTYTYVGISLTKEKTGSWWICLLKKVLPRMNLFGWTKFDCINKCYVFLSCTPGVSGKMLDRKYLEKKRENEVWSNLKFPVEKPPKRTSSFGKRRLDLWFQ